MRAKGKAPILPLRSPLKRRTIRPTELALAAQRALVDRRGRHGSGERAMNNSPKLGIQDNPDGAPVELDLSDTFHRLKRTTLLLSGAAILLGSGISVAKAFSEVGFPADSGPSSFLRLLVWLAATYYFWGFLYEFRAEHRRNRELWNPSALPHIEHQLGSAVTLAEEYIELLRRSAKGLQDVAVSLKGDVYSFVFQTEPDNHLVRTISELERARQIKARIGPPTPNEAMLSRDPDMLYAQLQTTWSMLGQRLDGIAHYSGRIANDLSELKDSETRATEALRLATAGIKLNRRIHRDRRTMFWIWEGSATFTMWTAATLATFTTWGFSLASAVDLVARSFN